MSTTYIAAALRRQVEKRARGRCEYCLLHADDAYYSHHVDHVIAEKHGGATDFDNLAFCCAECNLRKGSDLASLSQSGRLTALFNPRRQRWSAHFHLESGIIETLSVTGEVTARLLAFNEETRVEVRRTLSEANLYPRN